MLKLLLLVALLFTLAEGQNITEEQADEATLEDAVQLEADDELQDEAEFMDEFDMNLRRSDARSRSNNKKRDIYDDNDYLEYDSRPQKRPVKGKGGRVRNTRAKKHRELDREPQKGPLITREDICYRLKLNVLRDFERYIDLYIEKCKINSM